jgi:putative membrane-bound dehydrogenase-like protein
MNRSFSLVLVLLLSLVGSIGAEESKAIKILFLGDNGHHRPAERFRQLQPVLARRGIELTYTDKVTALNPKLLASYDGLLLYANTTSITPAQEKALLDFVEGGKGFIPLHCASYCFLNSPKYIALVGAQFARHGTGTVRTTIAEPAHPVMKGFSGFESWDETYVHTRHNDKDRIVLEYRDREPWTWVRTQGKGRVFYTAWGHDQRTWGHPGFQNLVERGIRWATGNDPGVVPDYQEEGAFPVPEMTAKRTDVKPFEYIDVGKKIPNYTPSARWGTQGEPFHLMQKPLPAEESLKHMVVPKGFHVELFASDPDIGKAICMNWDERGRLWIAETVDYPNELQPPGGGRDRIRICEDTDGDGKADRFTVFAEKLSIPTSLTFSKGGVIVFNGTQTIYLKDTDGDDRADERKVLFGTWNQRDTHGGPSNMQYGLDNWIWAMQGYNPSRLEVGGKTHPFRQGFFRFKPDASDLEFLRSTDNNTWGLGISEEGIVFGSTANRNPSTYMPIPNRYYEAVRGWAPSLVLKTIADSFLFKPITDKVRQVDQHGGYTAGAGHALYTARTYPREYWNRTAFVNGPTGHLVGTFVLRKEGSDFHSANRFNLVASDDEWTAPIMAEVGPDGQVWVIDWYNFIVQHNPTPRGFKTGKGSAYETDLRDKKHGRIYRIVYDGAPSRPAFSLKDASPEKLVATLKNDNLLWRRHAQRLLVERGKQDVVPALIELARDPGVDEIGLNAGVIHALWTLHGLGALDGSNGEALAVAVAALKHRSAGVRRNAVQVLPREAKSTSALLAAGLLHDPDAQVRLMTLLAFADLPGSAAVGQALVEALDDPINTNDRWLPDALTCAAAHNSAYFLEAQAEKKPSAKRLVITEVVAEHYARGRPVDSVKSLLAKLAEADPTLAEAVVRGLARGWPATATLEMDEPTEQALDHLVARLPASGRGVLVRLGSIWGSKKLEKYTAEVIKALLARVRDSSLRPEERASAARELIAINPVNSNTVTSLLALLTPQTSPELAAGLLGALANSEAAGTGEKILERLPGLTPAVRASGVRVILGRAEWTRTLLDAAEKGTFRIGELSLDQKQALAAHPDRRLRRRARALLERGGVLPNADRQKVLEELLPVTREKGDPAAGKVVFKEQCAKCHTHSGEGAHIGPDLTGMAVHPKEELLANIIDPSRSVEGNYRIYTVLTTKGTVLNGLLAAESRTAVELFDVEGKKHTILREDIDELTASPKSLMPDGFEKQIKRKQLADLLAFLTQRGKYLPLSLAKVATVVSTRGMFNNENSRIERLVFPDWKPKTVEGVPFILVDPLGDRVKNAILLYGPQGRIPPRMPRSVTLPCNAPVKAIHLLSGVSGWGHPYGTRGSVSLIVRLHYADGKTEDHELKNGEHFADYIRRVDVPGSKFAFNLRGRQLRYLAVQPKRTEKIERIELVKGPDDTAPVVMAVTLEALE